MGNIMIIKSLKIGVSQMWLNKRLIFVYYLVNFIFGIILMLPFRSILNNFVGHRLMGAKLGGYLDWDFVFDFLTHRGSAMTAYLGLFLILPVLYGAFLLFMSGGVLKIFVSGEKYSPMLFWGNNARYFGRFVRLFLWSIPVILILFCLQFIWQFFQRIVFGTDPYQSILYWGAWIKVALRYISILMIYLVFDYARIHLVITDERKTRISVFNGIKFAFKNFWKTFGLSLLLFLIGAIVLIIYNPVADLLHAPNSVVILILFILQQSYMLFRMMLKLTKFSSQVHLYQSLTT